MIEKAQPVSIAPLLTTVVIIAACTSALWIFFWQQHEQSRDQQLQNLAAELEMRREREADLLNRHATAEEARRRSEQTLLEVRAQLDAVQNNLARMEDWEAQYRAAALKNHALYEQLNELELRHAIARDRLESELTLLLGRHTDLKRDHAELADAHKSLEQALATQSDLNQAYHQLQLDHQAAQDELRALEQSLADSTQQLEQARLATGSAANIATPDANIAAPAITATTSGSGTTPGYRLVRLQSLGNAMHGRSSDERRSILTSVIPTIPNGVDGSELVELVAGMDSSHILQVIEATRQNINTPLDRVSLDTITAQLDESDARGAMDMLQR